jgi:HK97 family phage portal protein
VAWFRRKNRDVEERDLFASSAYIPTWSEISGGATAAGVPVTLNNAIGLPAVGSAIRLLCETIGNLPLNVYRGRGADKRLADNAWQYRLLAEMPGLGDFTPFDLLSDIVACLETAGNAYVQKVKAAGEVIALIVIDPSRVRIDREDGEKVFRIRNQEGREDTYTAGTILHIRGFTVNGADAGISPIAMHRPDLGTILAQHEFAGRFYGQGTHVGTVVNLPADAVISDEQAERLSQSLQTQKSGVSNAHKPIIMQKGATLERLNLSMADAQFVESEHLNLLQVAHIFRIPPSFLVPQQRSGNQMFEQDNLRFYTLGLAPRLRRIELAFFADADLFPQRIIYPEFDVRKLLRTDAKTQAEVDHFAIQDGTALPDEVRADRGLPPLPPLPADPTLEPGKVPQVTPVGGAPNPAPNSPVGAADDSEG